MSKHRKTRQEKIIADLRHQLYSLNEKSFSPIGPSLKPTVAENTIKESLAKTISPNIASYLYLKHDVLKALTLAAIIVALQFILLFTLKNHVIMLPGIHY